MYIESVPNRNSPPALLPREAKREGGKIRKKTLANLTHWPEHVVAGLRLLLRKETLVPKDKLLRIERSLPHGHVEALITFVRHIGLETMIGSTPSRERDLVMAMLVSRLVHGSSKLATTRLWNSTTLAEEIKVADATRTTSMAPWIGSWRGRSASRRSWRCGAIPGY